MISELGVDEHSLTLLSSFKRLFPRNASHIMPAVTVFPELSLRTKSYSDQDLGQTRHLNLIGGREV